jgi:hypothetical protein
MVVLRSRARDDDVWTPMRAGTVAAGGQPAAVVAAVRRD